MNNTQNMFNMKALVRDSLDLPGHVFIRLEFSDWQTDKVINIMENHVKPRYVVRWISSQIKFVRGVLRKIDE